MSPNPIYHFINGLYTEKQDSNKVTENDLVENILDGQGKKYIGNKLKYIGNMLKYIGNILKYIGKGKMLESVAELSLPNTGTHTDCKPCQITF